MVFYFTTINPDFIIYMGKDKYENELLIKHGWPEDLWFHVDKLSSAHVYLRCPKGTDFDSIPKDVLDDCCQLVKANSIQGNKLNNVGIVYTPWSNLKKTNGMDVGQVGFHSSKKARVIKVEKRNNAIVNRLNKTKVENYPDLAAEKEARDAAERKEKNKLKQIQKQKEKEAKEQKLREKELREYRSLMTDDNMVSNKDMDMDMREYEDSFM